MFRYLPFSSVQVIQVTDQRSLWGDLRNHYHVYLPRCCGAGHPSFLSPFLFLGDPDSPSVNGFWIQNPDQVWTLSNTEALPSASRSSVLDSFDCIGAVASLFVACLFCLWVLHVLSTISLTPHGSAPQASPLMQTLTNNCFHVASDGDMSRSSFCCFYVLSSLFLLVSPGLWSISCRATTEPLSAAGALSPAPSLVLWDQGIPGTFLWSLFPC